MTLKRVNLVLSLLIYNDVNEVDIDIVDVSNNVDDCCLTVDNKVTIESIEVIAVDNKVDNVTVVVVVPNINFSHQNCEDDFLNLMKLTTIALWSTSALLRPSRLSS